MDISHKSLKEAVEEYEKQLILNELLNTNNKIAEAARSLEISKQLLKYKVNKYML